jgi:acetyl CoA:N6-hydroxylysine acetyl transferase
VISPLWPVGPVPAGSQTFRLREVRPETDLELLHGWMNDPEVARFWGLAVPPSDLAAYLEGVRTSAHASPAIGCLDGVPMSYWELYRADLDPLARHYAALPNDAGLHLLLNSEHRGKGLGATLIELVSSSALAADARAMRVVAEPDVRNRPSIRAFERAGFRRQRDLDLPGKRAALMVRQREAAR